MAVTRPRPFRARGPFNVEWTGQMLADFETRPEVLETEGAGECRIGELAIVANSSEFFTTLAQDVQALARRRRN